MTATTSQQELVRFLEDRFACAQACTECARACALHVSASDSRGPDGRELVRRKAITCVEVCDATCRLLAEQNRHDETALRLQVEWCRATCLDCAHVLDGHPGGEDVAKACRDCADACALFVATLS